MELSDILGHEPVYQLQIKFLGGAKLPYGEYISHPAAVEAVKRFVDFLKEEHKANRTSQEFQLQINNADTYSVLKTNNKKRYNETGLYLVLYIVETIGEHLSEEEKLKLGINPHKVVNGKEREFSKKPNLPGEINWGEL